MSGGRIGTRGAVRTGGVRDAEAWLIASVEAEARAGLGGDAAAVEAAVAALSRPLRIVVPSGSLRTHVCERLMAHHGRALLGVEVATLYRLATEILARAGLRPAAAGLVPVLAQRAARGAPALAAGLDALVDGYGAVVAGVDDLLDAGFEPHHAEALREQVDALAAGAEPTARALALVQVAEQVATQLASGRAGHRALLYRLAREQLEQQPQQVLPARAVCIYGFADATGVQADLLEALVRHAGARVVLDAPPEPGQRAGQPPARRFGRAFVERIEALAAPEEAGLAPPAAPSLVLLRAPARGPEVRAVAARVRAALDAGVAPERIAIVARDLTAYRTALRRHLTRLAIPFSGVGERGGATAARRQLDALERLLEAGTAAPMEHWLDAQQRIHRADGHLAPLAPERRAELLHGLHARGALRLAQVAELAPADDVRLDARLGLRASASAPGAGAAGAEALRAVHRHLPQPALAAAVRSAGAVVQRLRARPGRASVDAHRDWLLGLAGDLGWVPSRPGLAPGEATPGRDALGNALRELPVPDGFLLEADELALLLRRALSGAGYARLGGEGGGVQVLSVMEARARSFEQLFVLGLSRGVFPRPVTEDPLLPDALRQRLRDVLPDLPVKRDGFDEERFLFAQLLSAAERVVLSYPEKDDAGRPLPRSPLLEPLLRSEPVVEEQAPALHAPAALAGPTTPTELALLAGLHGSRSGFAQALGAALAPAPGPGSAGREVLVAARTAVLNELELRRAPLGPYHGLVGAVQPADPRRGDLHVTTLEALARCPWQAFLRRLLGLAPAPDALGPLPGGVDPLLLGNTVHQALEWIAEAPARASLDALQAAVPLRPAWPDPAALDALLLRAAHAALAGAPVGVPGYEQVLALHARPCVEHARRVDWAWGPPAVLGVEAYGVAEVPTPQGPRRIHFRADRVDLVEGDDGTPRLRLTDYKTGKPVSEHKTPEKRREVLAQAIAEGRLLQAAAYARAAGERSEGRYLYLADGLDDATRTACVDGADALQPVFEATAGALLAAWERGSFVPRLRGADDDEEPWACQGCEVKEACLRGDSGARHRLGRFLDDTDAHEALDPVEQAALGVLRLGSAPS